MEQRQAQPVEAPRGREEALLRRMGLPGCRPAPRAKNLSKREEATKPEKKLLITKQRPWASQKTKVPLQGNVLALRHKGNSLN